MTIALTPQTRVSAQQAVKDRKQTMRRAITSRVGPQDTIIFGREGELIRVGWIKHETGQGVDITRLVAAAFGLELCGSALLGANVFSLILCLLEIVPSNDWRLRDLDPNWKAVRAKAA